MFEPRKKIRDLNKELDKQNVNPELHEIIKAVQANGPDPASTEFRDKLKQQLLAKHHFMSKNPHKEIKEKASFWSDMRVKGLAMAMGILVLVILGGVVSYPMIPAPTVQGYILKNSIREISQNAPIKITFTQLMDNASVEKALKIEPALPGKVSWSGNTLIYTPDRELKLDEVFQVSIGKEAVSLLRKPLGGEYSESYKIVKAPEVSLFTPNNDSSEVPLDSQITMMFDRPMTGLTTLEASDGKFPELKIEPSLNGKMKWLGTSALQFVPEKGLNPATTYKITLPAGAEVLDGGKTTKDFSSTFRTMRPDVVSFETINGIDTNKIAVEDKLLVKFNQKMDLSKAGELVRLNRVENTERNDVQVDVRYYNANDWKDQKAAEQKRLEMSTYEEVKEELNKEPANTTVVEPEKVPSTEEMEKWIVITPREKMKSESNFYLVFKPEFKGLLGDLTLDGERTYAFITPGEFKMEGKNGFSNEWGLASPSFNFSNGLDLSSFRGKIKMSPLDKDENGKEIEPQVWTSYGDTQLVVSTSFKPSTNYKIEIVPGVRDIYGNTLNEGATLEFTSKPYSPSLTLESGTDIAVVDGTKPALFYAKSVNINSVDLSLKALSKEELMNVYKNGYIDGAAQDSLNKDFSKSVTLPVRFSFNEYGYTELNLDKLNGSKLAPGFYLIKIWNEKVARDSKNVDSESRAGAIQPVIVSNTSLAVKSSLGELVVWATDMAQGNPVEGMKLTAVNRDGVKLEGLTDKNGIARIKTKVGEDEAYAVDYNIIGEKDGDFAFVNSGWSEGVAPWNFNISSDSYTPKYYGYLYTDRPIYRPSQEVFFKGIIRKDNDGKFTLPDVAKAKVEITDASGNNIYTKELDMSANGTFTGSVMLGENIVTGDYSVKAGLVGAKGPEWANSYYGSFKVYEYRKPEYKLDLNTDNKDYVNGQKAKVKVNAAYFFGAPLPKAQVNWSVKSADYYFILPEELANKLNGTWFSFAEEGFFCYWGCEGTSALVTQGSGTTDDQGYLEIEVPLQISDKKMSQIYTMEVNVSDANNQSVASRISFPVHQGQVYAGIRSEDYIVNTKDPAKFEVLTVKPSGEIASGQSVEVALYKREWNTIKRKNVDGGYYYENNYDDKLVTKQGIRTAENGLAKVEFAIKEGGSYKVEASLKDSLGNTVKSSTSVYVGGSEYINWGSENNDKIELVTDKTEYQVGDVAKIMIKSPYKGVKALITTEKDRVLSTKIVTLDSNSQTIEVPVTEQFVPNAFVSVVLVKGSSNTAGISPKPPQGTDGLNGKTEAAAPTEAGVAAFKVGYATLQVDTKDKNMKVEISSDKAVYGPKEKVKLTLKTSDIKGAAVAGDLSVAVVDQSVLSLTESVTADLLNVFYRQRNLGVVFAHTLTKAISRVNVLVEAGNKGGGGGAEAKRGVFKDTAFFTGTVKTDANGIATLEFELPDNLTTWEVMAIGISNDKKGSEKTLVGSNKYDFVVNKEILARPVLPRFMTAGDEMTVSAIVHNYTTDKKNIEVSLKSTGITLVDSAERRVDVDSKGSAKVNWKIKVGNGLSDGAEAKLTFSAMSGDKGDVIEQVLPIHQANFPSFVSTSKVVNGDAKEVDKVWLPNGLDTNFGKLTISANATLAGTLNSGLEYLMTYPYGCTEQLTSSILPNLALKKLMDTGKFDTKSVDAKQVRKNVEAGLQMLYKNQLPSGGFGLWSNSNANAYLTAYVVNMFDLAEKNGFTVDKVVKNLAVDFLKKSVTNNSWSDDQYLSNNPANYKAYILYVLAEIGQADVGLLNNLMDDSTLYSRLSLASKAYLAMAYQKAGSTPATQKRVDLLRKDLENAAKSTPRGVKFEENVLDYRLFDTNTRTTAIVLQALNRIDSSNPLIPKILSNLLKEKQGNGAYSTTQETAITLLALMEYMDSSKELSPAYNALVTVNGKTLIDQGFTSANLFETKTNVVALKDLLANNLDNEITAQRTGKGNLYLDASLEYYLPLADLKARNEGVEVSQEYFSMDDKKMEKPLTETKVGQNLHGKMTIIVPEERNYLMVEDFLPAGLEGIDFNLKTSDQSLNETETKGGCYYEECYGGSSWYFNHTEVRDDRMMFFADYLPAGVYTLEYYVRATSVGNFADLPVLAQETYYPEVFGRSAGKMFKVNE